MDIDIKNIDSEIQSIQKFLEASINLRYGLKTDIGKILSTEEHFAMWDRMWDLIKQKNMLKKET